MTAVKDQLKRSPRRLHKHCRILRLVHKALGNFHIQNAVNIYESISIVSKAYEFKVPYCVYWRTNTIAENQASTYFHTAVFSL